MRPSRREVLQAGAGAAAALGIPAMSAATTNDSAKQPGEKFTMKFAPHFGMFKHHAGDDLVDQLKFSADEGFHAWEDNGMMGRDVATQEKLAKAMDDLGIEMGVFVAHAEWREPMYATGNKDTWKTLQDQMRKAVEVGKRVNAKWTTVVPGPSHRGLDWDYQTANVIDCLKAMAEIYEPAGMVMVLEPLNPRDHAGMFLSKIPQAYQICKAVDSPACKILNDLYHQQITEGNLIPNINRAWEQTPYYQIGDNPGRREPTTGEINYRNVFGHIQSKGFSGIMGMEHGNSQGGKEGERKVINAYRSVDPD